jgi:hypothetical protein
MEQLNYFVSSRGLLRTCSNHNLKPKSSSDEIDKNILKQSEILRSIYVCTDALDNFSNNFIKNVDREFILLTGDSDTRVDMSLINSRTISNLIQSPYLLHWYAQNLEWEDEKISQLPIGLDYHTMWEIPGLWGLKQQSSLSQERTLIEVLAQSLKTEDRAFQAYCNWHFALNRGDREICINSIQKELCYFEPNKVPRLTTWQRQANCIFVISPEGAGIDCHRSWEAILLGCIPIVKKSKFSKIFDDLPVIQINNWNECNFDNLNNIYIQIKNKKFNFTKLFLNYWRNLIQGLKPFALEPMTINEFKNFICLSSH